MAARSAAKPEQPDTSESSKANAPGQHAQQAQQAQRAQHAQRERAQHAQRGQQAAGEGGGAPRRKPVVTAFVRRGNGDVLVVRRSDKVGTFRGQWGGVSGGLEGAEAPRDRALTEIEEEAGLPASALRLVRSGRPQRVYSGRLHFTVHSFLFELTDESAPVRLNWENTEYAWVPPQRVKELDGVPGLGATLERVCLSPHGRYAVDRLVADRDHGAAQLAGWALDALDEAAESGDGRTGNDAGGPEFTRLRNLGYHLATARPGMAPIANAVAGALLIMSDELRARADPFDRVAGEIWKAAKLGVAQQRHELAAAARALREQARAALAGHDSVMTLSYSSSVRDALCAEAQARAAAGDSSTPLRVVVSESRPRFEGVRLANELAEDGAHVTVTTEAQAALAVAEAGLVVVGADTVLRDALVNKVGTHPLALAAREAGVPVLAVADTSKFSPGPLEALAHPRGGGAPDQATGWDAHEEKSAHEVTDAWRVAGLAPDARIAVRNLYFEATPLGLLAGVVTERGVLPPEQAEAEIGRRLEAFKRAFHLD